ncbi:hypothetical protein ACHAXA_011829 [Cyclostephanos tholiformis]|uniref:Uncharacterized protein n=1 Tax=Cyclostephanos tholiformis TaxID=382380 RepID=A0ABD3RWC6_9STRA
MKSMFASSIILLALGPSTPLLEVVDAFSPPWRGRTMKHHPIRHSSPARGASSREHRDYHNRPSIFQSTRSNARMINEEEEEDDDVDREFVYAARRSGRRGREEGGRRPGGSDYDVGGKSSSARSSSPSSRYQEDVEFFDLDDDDDDDDEDDDLFENDDFVRKNRRGRDGIIEEEITYNGIIPNPLLDAMDPDGVYERLGPELFKDWTFFRDMALFALFLTLFTGDTHLYGTFDSVIERLEDLPSDFIK